MRIALKTVEFVSDERWENYGQSAKLSIEGDARGPIQLTYHAELHVVEVVLPVDTDPNTNVTTWRPPQWLPMHRVRRMNPILPSPTQQKK